MGRLENYQRMTESANAKKGTWKTVEKFVVGCLSGNVRNRVLLTSHAWLWYCVLKWDELECVVSLTVSLAALLICWWWRATTRYYEITKKHIQRTGRLDENFLIKSWNDIVEEDLFDIANFKEYILLLMNMVSVMNSGHWKEIVKLVFSCLSFNLL